MKKIHNYKYTKFTINNVRDLNSETGLFMYKVVALPMSFSRTKKQKEITKDYATWFSDFYIRKWDNQQNLNISFNRTQLNIKLPQNEIHNLNKNNCIYKVEEDGLFKIYEQMISFLPPLYIGITNDIKTRFQKHTNESNDESLINMINNHDEINENEILFIWQDLDVNFVEKYLQMTTKEARKTLLEDLETLFIQINNPIFNKNKRK